MSKRFWLYALAGLLLLLLGYEVGLSRVSAGAPLRSEHSQPPVKVPDRLVAVTAEGKTFHDPSCKYIHGAVEMMTAPEAIRRGYTPCVRCMREALKR